MADALADESCERGDVSISGAHVAAPSAPRNWHIWQVRVTGYDSKRRMSARIRSEVANASMETWQAVNSIRVVRQFRGQAI